MKNFIKLTATSLIFFFLLSVNANAQNSYVNYLYNSSPSLQASRQLAGQVDGWFKDMDKAIADYQRKYPNGNPQAEARGRAFISGMQGAYQIQENASIERRKAQLKRRYTDIYNKAKSWRDYYWSRGYYQDARKMEKVMNTYNPKKYKW
jgi:uncharacterized protein (DUF3084 family)